MKNYDIPPQPEEENKKLEIKPKPEIPKGGKENTSETENGQPLKHEILDENGNVIYHEEKWYQKDQTSSPETIGGHRQQFFQHDEQGRVVEEVGQSLSTKEGDPKHENQWKIVTEWGDKDDKTQIGIIETGPDAGHKWKTSKELIHDFGDGRKIVKETTEIIKQGKNPAKPSIGTTEKIKFFKGKQWLGERTKDSSGKESKFLAAGVEKLPNWEDEINS
ncbi:MAG: hypothetical protein COT24_01590 [Candidatus Kerfeldbacteria bacterium CG08_land_8_20_14_0_20_40_16]|uniref:Uncharacterized protein n=1 Tax=Candidatus Kerfeldbacteria bacterium CG08_land_8_20_14_0_20_40_16 TaxID=2014244 RepID=A0A2H0YWD0_9BACT|nr:MAG: hypothetical protein COT24_01590 [Candidatus Kerfeldbacteria bacterium CG08_land_8_20_14_0_20_40_16]